MGFDGTVNIPTLFTLLVTLAGAVAWLVRLEGRVNSNTSKHKESVQRQTDANHKVEAIHALCLLLEKQHSDYRLHVAETYVTKQGMSEQTDRIMKAINDVGNRIDGLGSRLDRFYEHQPNAPRRTGP
ncbi:MAG: hypothetical protein ACOH2N_00155 [Devosia sp.]